MSQDLRIERRIAKFPTGYLRLLIEDKFVPANRRLIAIAELMVRGEKL